MQTGSVPPHQGNCLSPAFAFNLHFTLFSYLWRGIIAKLARTLQPFGRSVRHIMLGRMLALMGYEHALHFPNPVMVTRPNLAPTLLQQTLCKVHRHNRKITNQLMEWQGRQLRESRFSFLYSYKRKLTYMYVSTNIIRSKAHHKQDRDDQKYRNIK